MKLQACHQCGAQFDISAFSAGQQFTCGSCGAVLVAGQAGGAAATRQPQPRTGPSSTGQGRRQPSAPQGRQAGRAPAARTPGGSSGARSSGQRGPQFTPRHSGGGQQAKAAPRSGGSRSAAASRSGGGGSSRSASRAGGSARQSSARRSSGPAKKNNMMLPLAAIGGVLVIVILMVVLAGGDDTGDPSGKGTDVAQGGGKEGGGTAKQPDPTPKETWDAIVVDFNKNPPATKRQWHRYFDRLDALGTEAAKKTKTKWAEDYIADIGYDDKELRAYLGYTEFTVPEEVFEIEDQYPYIRAVKFAAQERWFSKDDADALALANKALAQATDHLEKLGSDHEFRARDQIYSFVKKDPFFKDYNFETRWTRPFLICYSSKERLSEFELMKIQSRDERRRKLAELREKRAKWERILDEKEKIFRQVYDKYMELYQERLGLKDLFEPYGGRPELPQGQRNFRDGVPLVVWIFDNKASWKDYHENIAKEDIPDFAAGYFSPVTGWVYLYDEEASDDEKRVFEIGKNIHEAVHQLQHWFTRQQLKWVDVVKSGRNSQDWFKEGQSEYLGGHTMDKDRKVDFHGVNVTRLKWARQTAKSFKEQVKKEYPIFPIYKLITFRSYAECANWGASTWGVNRGVVQGMLYEQGWGLTHFFHHFEDGKYFDRYMAFQKGYLNRGAEPIAVAQAFKTAFNMWDEEEFEELQSEFESYMRTMLDPAKTDLSKYAYTPPGRDDWGDSDEDDPKPEDKDVKDENAKKEEEE